MRGNPIIIYIYNGSFRVILSKENVHENLKILYLYLNKNTLNFKESFFLVVASFRQRVLSCPPNISRIHDIFSTCLSDL
jgi:hypothetical protein